jgi:hypothetical protein
MWSVRIVKQKAYVSLASVLTPRRQQEQLRVECSDRDAQEIIADAIARVPGFAVPDGDIPAGDARLKTGLASLAIGDREFSHFLLNTLKRDDFLLFAARFFLWSGVDQVLRDQLPRIDRTLSETEPFAELHELAIALESIGAGAEAAAVRTRAANAQRRILPDWEAHDCNELPAANAADTVNVLMHALLGAAPDAARGRLRLRPCLPDWLDSLAVHNIRMADALITLRYERVPKNIRYSIEQVAGAMPVRLVFEPSFMRKVNNAFVDDVTADLAYQVHGNRVLAPVQLMLDHERVVRFDMA